MNEQDLFRCAATKANLVLCGLNASWSVDAVLLSSRHYWDEGGAIYAIDCEDDTVEIVARWPNDDGNDRIETLASGPLEKALELMLAWKGRGPL